MSRMVFVVLTLLSSFCFANYKLALNWKPEPQFGGFYEAERAGFFKNQKLEVAIMEGGSGTPTVQMLSNGKVDFAIVSAEEILLLNDKNPKDPVVAVFASFQTNPQIIMSHAEKNFKNLKEVFDGDGIIAMQSGLSYAKFLNNKFGKPKAKIVPYLGGISNFLTNPNYSQQGFLTSEPLSAEKAGQKVKSFLIADEGFNPYVTVVAVKKSFLDSHRGDVEKFVLATRQGWEAYLKTPDQTNQKMALLNKSMDLETFKKSAQTQVPLITDPKAKNFKVGTMTDSRWETLADQMLSLGLIKSKGDPKAAFTNM